MVHSTGNESRTKGEELSKTIPFFKLQVESIEWSPDGKWLLVNTGNNIEFLTAEHVLGDFRNLVKAHFFII